jgi:hypothetical protein
LLTPIPASATLETVLRVKLVWANPENRLPVAEVQVYCREAGQTEQDWKFAGLAQLADTSVTVESPDLGTGEPFQTGKNYEFSLVNAATPGGVVLDDSPYSTVLSVTT